MRYRMKETKRFKYGFVNTYESAYLGAKSLKGKILKHDPDNRELHLQFDKTLHGKYLGDRSRFEIKFISVSTEITDCEILAYPVNPIGQELRFGARNGVVPKVLDAFYASMVNQFEASNTNS